MAKTRRFSQVLGGPNIIRRYIQVHVLLLFTALPANGATETQPCVPTTSSNVARQGCVGQLTSPAVVVSVTFSNICVDEFTERLGTLSYSGDLSAGATTVDACQAACLAEPTCVFVDFDFNLNECFLHGSDDTEAQNTAADNVNQYTLVTRCLELRLTGELHVGITPYPLVDSSRIAYCDDVTDYRLNPGDLALTLLCPLPVQGDFVFFKSATSGLADVSLTITSAAAVNPSRFKVRPPSMQLHVTTALVVSTPGRDCNALYCASACRSRSGCLAFNMRLDPDCECAVILETTELETPYLLTLDWEIFIVKTVL